MSNYHIGELVLIIENHQKTIEIDNEILINFLKVVKNKNCDKPIAMVALYDGMGDHEIQLLAEYNMKG